MKWCITGGCGFLGVNLVRSLVAEGGHGVRVIDNLSVGSAADLRRAADFRTLAADHAGPIPNAGVELIVGDILDRSALEHAVEAADAVVHFAANAGVAQSVEDPLSDCTTNVIGTLNCLEAARRQGVRRFVFASSGAPLGAAEPPIHESLPAQPVSPYGASKLAGEGYCSAYARTFGLATVALRFGNVYGPGSAHKGSVVAAFISRALKGMPLVINGDGAQTRDFIFVDDLIRAVRLAATVDSIGGEVFQIATSRETTLLELVDELRPLLTRAGLAPKIVHGEVRLGDVLRSYSDTTKADRLLGWRAEIGLREGLGRTLGWFLAAAKR